MLPSINRRISNASMKCNLSSSKRVRNQSTGKLIPNSVASTHQRKCPPSVTVEKRTHSIAVQDATVDFVIAGVSSAVSQAA